MQTWIYKHYKWKLYEVLWLAMNSETREKLVVYKCLYETPELYEEFWNNPFFVRPYDMFLENVNIDWKIIPRFKYIWNETYKTT